MVIHQNDVFDIKYIFTSNNDDKEGVSAAELTIYVLFLSKFQILDAISNYRLDIIKRPDSSITISYNGSSLAGDQQNELTLPSPSLEQSTQRAVNYHHDEMKFSFRLLPSEEIIVEWMEGKREDIQSHSSVYIPKDADKARIANDVLNALVPQIVIFGEAILNDDSSYMA